MKISYHINQIKKDESRNNEFLHLTANENILSETARQFLSSKIADRYYMGGGKNGMIDNKPFTALGLEGVAELVSDAERALKKMLGAKVVNINCLSGVHAMMCAILSTTKPGEVIMTVHHDHGGHFATKGIIDRVGRKHAFVPYDMENLSFDVKKMATLYKEVDAKALYLDVSYYISPHNLKEIRAALGKDAVIIYDASHTVGLMMGGEFQDPFADGADVICANTHKTLPGPHKGLIAFRDEKFGEKANAIINGCLYSTTQTGQLIALAITILEMEEFGRDYAKQIVANSRALAESLSQLGYLVRQDRFGNYSANHQVHLLTSKIGPYFELYKKLYANKIAVNFDDMLGKGVFVRLGTQEITRRGMKEKEMSIVASLIDLSFKGKRVEKIVDKLMEKHQKAKYSFD